MSQPEPYDPMCSRTPEEIGCYDDYLEDGQTASEYVRLNEGTYNRENGHFLCDACYIKAGMPLGVCP